MSHETRSKTFSRRDFMRASAIGAAGALLAACGAPPATEAPKAEATKAPEATQAPAATEAPTAAPAAEKKSVYVFECCWNQAHIDAGKKLYTGFQEKHADIVLDVFWNPPSEDWTAKLLAKVAANDPMDIVWWCASHHKFAEEGRLLDLTELLNADSSFKLDAYQAVGVDFCYDKPKRQGALWGLPTNYATVLLWYNMKMFDAAGIKYPTNDWTYSDLLTAAQALSKDTNGDGTNDEWGIKIGTDPWYYQPVIEAMGGGICDVYADTPCLLTKPESIAALQWLHDLFHKHKVAPMPADMAGMGEQAMMISDKLAMGFWPEWGQFEFLPAHKDTGFKYGVVMLPKGKDGKRVTDYWAGITSIMKGTKSPQAAWETAKFICGEEYQRVMTVDLPESPAALNKVTEYRFKEYDQYPDDRSSFLESPKYGTQFYVINRYGKETSDIINPALDPVWEGKAVPADVVNDICTKVDAKVAELKAAVKSGG